MRTALVGATQFNSAHFHTQYFDYCIAVDAGLRSCLEAHVEPDIAIGDFDSLGFVPDTIPTMQFPAEKNESDMELACMHAQEQGAHTLFLYGAFAGRLDHTLANIAVAVEYANRGLKVIGIGDEFALVVLTAAQDGALQCPDTVEFLPCKPSVLEGTYAPYISVFAYSQEVSGLDIDGLKYSVSNFTLTNSCSRGLSNQFVGKKAHIHITQGALLVTMPLAALEYASLTCRKSERDSEC